LGRRKELTDYTVGGFAADQFTHARLEFLAWYEVAQNPQTATDHPFVLAHFGATLDAEDAAEILRWWSDGLNELLTALNETQDLLKGDVVLSDPRVEKLLTIIRHTENVIDHLLQNLDEARLQDA
jgi:hypothetical protein